MRSLTTEERLYIIAGALGLLLATVVVMACKLLPCCWLHGICPLTKKHKDEEEETEKQSNSPIKPVNYGGVASKPPLPISVPPSEVDSCNTQAVKIQDESDSILNAYSAFPQGRRGIRPVRPIPSHISLTTSDTSSREPSPLLRSGFAFPDLTDSPDDEQVNRGAIDLAVQYSVVDEKILVNVKGAQNLPLSIYGTTNDVFVKVILIRDLKRPWRRRSIVRLKDVQTDRSGNFSITEFKTQLIRRTTNPIFNDQFEAILRDRDRKHASLKFLTYVSDRYSHQTISGEADLVLHRLELQEKRDFSLPLKPVQQNLGSLFLSLSYLPTAERLSVTIVKAVDLRSNSDKDELLNPYVRAALILRTKTLEKHKIPPQGNTVNPTFNETVSFALRSEDLEKVCLVFTVCHRDIATDSPETDGAYSSGTEPASSPKRSVSTPPYRQGRDGYVRRKSIGTMIDIQRAISAPQDTGSCLAVPPIRKSSSTNSVRIRSTAIGRVVLGANVNGLGQAHWIEVIGNPRTQISRWHKLEP